MAPWISLGIEEAKKRTDIELHVISPHRWIGGIKEFSDGNIHYHFFNPGIPLIGRHWPRFFRVDMWTSYFYNKKVVKYFVERIKPDIINLHGAENSYYSSTIFQFKNKPVLITIQGLKHFSVNKSSSKIFKNDLYIEKSILEKFKYFGIRVDFLVKYIKSLNSDAVFYWFKYPFSSSLEQGYIAKKKYDLVFFARVSRDKGIEDLIEALGILKERGEIVSLNIIGSINDRYRRDLKNMLNDNNISNNVKILGFLNNKSDLHKFVSESKITVLPTYNDILPGTIIESLKIGTPVIAYSANGVVDFNKEKEVIKLVELGNINSLANAISKLLNNSEERERLEIDGMEWFREFADNEKEFEKLMISYREIISKY